MPAGSVSIATDGTETKSGLAGDIYDQRKAALALVDPPGLIPNGAAGVPIKTGLALDANALATAIFGENAGSLPTGAVIPYAGTGTPPGGYLYCDGSAVSRTTYADLFTALGTAYGSGDGSTTFNLPDLRARLPLGVNNSGLPNGENATYSTRNRGATGGAETHTLNTTEIPAHAHGSTGLVYSTPGAGTLTIAAGLDFDVGGGTGSVGGGLPHSIMNPFLALNFIIKT
jgi:microcystin-dependent protein